MQPSLFESGIDTGAIISGCGTYRYKLWRTWDSGAPTCNFLMLNPSTADHRIDDPTIRRCVGYARSWGHGGIVVTNLFSLRSTDPTALKSAPDPIGPENDGHVVEAASKSALVVAAWGAHGSYRGRSRAVVALLSCRGIAMHCLTRTAAGEPGHPLFLKGDLVPMPMEGLP